MGRSMIDTAHIFGQLGKAIYKENDQYFLLGIESTKEPTLCRKGDVSLLLDCSSEVISIAENNLTLYTIENILKKETLSHKALILILSGLDKDLSDKSRSLSVESAEGLLEFDFVAGFLRARLLARPLPAESDILGALRLAQKVGAVRSHTLYVDIDNSQDAIRHLAEAWHQISAELSLIGYEKADVERGLIEAGIFADLAIGISAGDKRSLESTFATSVAKSQVKAVSHGVEVISLLQDRLIGITGKDSVDLGSGSSEQQASPTSSISNISNIDLTSSVETQRDKQHDARLILRLYELRRESVMREARNWFYTFDPTSVQDVMEVLLSEHSAYYRMVISYWEMACAFVNNGAIDEAIFNETNSDHVFVYAKMQPLIDELRVIFGSPGFLQNLETMVRRIPNIDEKTAKLREITRQIIASRQRGQEQAAGAA